MMMMNPAAKRRKIAGFFAQTRIIAWKNLMLYKSNRSGIACEIIFSCLFTFIFVFLVYFGNVEYEAPRVDDYDLPIIVRGMNPGNEELQNATRMFFYPENSFVQAIASEALDLMRAYSIVPLNVTLLGANVSRGSDLSDDDKKQLFAMISFPDNFSSILTVPRNVQYSIFTKE